MTFRGTIRNGQIEPDRDITLPEGTRVNIEPAAPARRARAPRASKPAKDPAFRIGDLAVPMRIADLAAQHDHYLYSTPKRPAPKRAAKSSRTKPARPRKGPR
ncbi:MAG TPA: hypothetical protein PKE29_17985 [Phycisphaerales bacterium]|nr:hypothetical protein [Phycisphaerales bacterium]